MPCECDDKYTRNYYQYYDTPDGCNVDKKIGVTTKYGVIAGMVAGTYDVLMHSHAVGFNNVMKRYAMHTIPLGLMGATFAVVANGVQHTREKDDKLNYFLGGLACGPILAAYLGNKHAVLLGGLALGVIASIKKDAIDYGVTLFPDVPSHMNTISSWRNDYTLCADPKDNGKPSRSRPRKRLRNDLDVFERMVEQSAGQRELEGFGGDLCPAVERNRSDKKYALIENIEFSDEIFNLEHNLLKLANGAFKKIYLIIIIIIIFGRFVIVGSVTTLSMFST